MTTKLGGAKFTIPAGKTVPVKITLTNAGLALVKQKGTLTANARASAVDARGGKPVVRTARVVLASP